MPEIIRARRRDRQGFGAQVSHACARRLSLRDRPAVARGRAIARQPVVYMQPGKLLTRMHMRCRRYRRRVVQGADIKMDLIRKTIGFIGNRRAAVAAERAPHPRRRGIRGRCAGGKGHLVRRKANKGSEWRPGAAPTALAMAMRHPQRLTRCHKTDRAAEAATGIARFRLGHGCHYSASNPDGRYSKSKARSAWGTTWPTEGDGKWAVSTRMSVSQWLSRKSWRVSAESAGS